MTTQLDGTKGFRLADAAGSTAGNAVNTADTNGDGYSDIIIGADLADTPAKKTLVP